MAPSVQYVTGFEHGFIGTGADANGAASSGGLVSALVLPANWSASTTNPRNGSYCAHLVAPASTVTNLRFNFGGGTKFVVRFGVKVSSRPSSGKVMLAAASDGSETFRVGISSAGVLECGNFTTVVTGPTIDTTSWHLIEVQYDNSGGTVDWKVDGVLQTRAAGVNGAFISEFYFGVFGAGAVGQAFTADYDDLIGGGWSVAATDWFGDGKVIAQRAGVDGTHATVTSLSPGDAGTAYSGTVTTANTMVDDPPGTLGWSATRSTTDNLALRTATVGAYLEIKPATTAEAGTANGVRAIISYSSPATGANLAGCDVRNSAGAVTGLRGLTGGVGAGYNFTANQFQWNIVTKPAAGWTAAEVNAIRFRFGGCTSADINPVPTAQAMMLEVDWPVAPSTTPVIATFSLPYESILPKAQTLTDTFATLDTAKWTSVSGAIAIVSGRLELRCALAGTTYANYESKHHLDLTSSFVYGKITPPTLETQRESFLQIIKQGDTAGTGSLAAFYTSGTAFAARLSTAGSNDDTAITYNASTMAWWRIRADAAGGSLYFETAPDDSGAPGTWTVQKTSTLPSWTTDCFVNLSAGHYAAQASDTVAYVDNINIAPLAATFALPFDSLTTLAVTSQEPIEARGVVAVTTSIPYEVNLGVSNVQPYSNLILSTSGLLDYWRLNETVGNMLDSKGANPGTTVGAGITRGVAGLIDGDPDKAISGAGGASTTSFVSIPASASMDVTNQLTVELWIQASALPVGVLPNIINRGQDHPWYIRHYASGDGRLEFNVYDSANTLIGGASGASDLVVVGVRQHIVMTYDSAAGATALKGFINGKQVISRAATANPNLLTGGAIVIGDRSAAWGSAFAGVIDEVALYNVALTQQQIYDHLNAGSGAIPFETRPPLVSITATFELPFDSLTRLADTDQEVIDTQVGIADTDVEPLETLVKLAVTASANIDALVKLADTDIEAIDATTGIQSTAQAPFDSIVGTIPVTATFVAPFETYVGGIVATASAPFDAQVKLAVTSLDPLETYVGGLVATSAANIDALTKLAITAAEPIETYVGGITVSAVANIDSLVRLAVTAVETVDAYVGGIQQLSSAPFEITLGVVKTNAAVIDTQLGISSATQVPFDSEGRLAVQTITTLPFDSYAVLAPITSTANLDTQIALQSTAATAFEALTRLASSSVTVFESQIGLVATNSVVYETLPPAIQALLSGQYEALLKLATVFTAPFEANPPPLAVTALVPLEVAKGVVNTTTAPLEQLLGLRLAAAPSFIDASGGIAIISISELPFDSFTVLRITAQTALEAQIGVISTNQAVTDIATGIVNLYDLNVDAFSRIANLYSIPLDSQVGGIVSLYSAPFELLQALAVQADTQLDSYGLLSFALDLPFDTQVGGIIALTLLPFDTQKGAGLPTRWLEGELTVHPLIHVHHALRDPVDAHLVLGATIAAQADFATLVHVHAIARPPIDLYAAVRISKEPIT